MEVAAFHPSALGRGLVSVALFVTSPCQGVTLHPALRSPDFPLCRREIPAHSGCLVLGAVIVASPPEGMQPQLVAVLIAAVVGGILGAWMASMAAAAVPNSRLKAFHEDIERGKVLLMLDVPYGRVEQIREVVVSRHPEAVAGGQASRYPAFP